MTLSRNLKRIPLTNLNCFWKALGSKLCLIVKKEKNSWNHNILGIYILELVTMYNEIWKVPNSVLVLLTFHNSEIWSFSQRKKKRAWFLQDRGSNPDSLVHRQLCLPIYHSHLLIRTVVMKEQNLPFVKFQHCGKLGQQARN